MANFVSVFIIVVILIAPNIYVFAKDDGCVFKTEMTDKEHPAIQRLNKLSGKRFSVSDNMNEYSFTVGICVDAETSDLPVPNAGIVQRKIAAPQSDPVTVGRHSDSNLMAGTNWLLLEYREGDNYKLYCGSEKRRGSIMLLCDPNETQGSLQLIEENTNKTGECYYLFELTHAAVCPEAVIVGQTNSLSGGSIFVILFFTLLIVYFVVGFLYQRFMAGAKGWEQFPNLSFWRDFGNLLADGCDLVCRSGQTTARRSTPESREYKGIGDDQLQDDDFDRDDHLLPM